MSHDVNAVSSLIPVGLMIGDTVEVRVTSTSMLRRNVIGKVTSINWETGQVRVSFWERSMLWDSHLEERYWCVSGDRLTIIQLVERSERTRRLPKSLEDYDLRGFKQC